MLILITPSQTQHEIDEIWTGNTNTVLSSDGIRDAQNLRYFDGIDADRVYIAPVDHVEDFAKITLIRGEYVLTPEFNDRSMGTLTGRKYRETMAEFPRRNWLAWHRSYWVAPPEGQSFHDMSERVLSGFREKVLPVKSTERVAIIASPDVLRVLIGSVSKVGEDDVPKIRIEPCVPHIVNGDID